MKITNWRRKVATTLVASGLLAPSAAHAADLGVNLAVNGGFETVDLATTGNYNGPRILNWTGPNMFAYSHNGSASSAGVVPDYADGADPPGAGNWYFSSNNTGVADPTDVRAADVFYQDINVASGPTSVAIAAGNATFALSGYFSSYLNDDDAGNVRADFRNAGGSIGNAVITDNDAGDDNVWNLVSTNGIIPVGTTTVRLSLFGTPVNGGADGYIDNVEFVIRGIPEPSSAMIAGLGFALGGLSLRRRRSGE
jgi:hypothetical protein